jgi:hypothetical protein
MRKKFDKVEIKDPPMQELNKKKSCLWRTCTTGCGFIIVFLILSLLFIRYATKPALKKIKTIPDNLAETMLLYDEDAISEIRFLAGADRSKAIERAALIPKIILSPILVTLEDSLTSNKSGGSTPTFNLQDIKQAISEPIADHRDLIQIEWTDLAAKPNFIDEWYQTELKKRNFEISISTQTEILRQFGFQRNNINGAVYIKDNPDTNNTDYILVTINIPPNDL